MDAPMRLELIKPLLHSGQGLAPQPKLSRPGIVSETLVIDQFAFDEDAEMVAHRRPRCSHGLGKFSGSSWVLGQQLDHPPPGWFSQDRKQLARCCIRHPLIVH